MMMLKLMCRRIMAMVSGLGDCIVCVYVSVYDPYVCRGMESLAGRLGGPVGSSPAENYRGRFCLPMFRKKKRTLLLCGSGFLFSSGDLQLFEFQVAGDALLPRE